MPSFSKSTTLRQPFGRNTYLRSTHPEPRMESYTVARTSVKQVTDADGQPRKILQPGMVMAKITTAAGTSTAADVGKVGPFDASATDGRQTAANIVGLNDTFLPWQLFDRDEDIAVAYDSVVAVQAWCFECDATGNVIALTNATATALQSALAKRGKVNFV